jgi:prepilin-type processing-associated H-X9-DG protein
MTACCSAANALTKHDDRLSCRAVANRSTVLKPVASTRRVSATMHIHQRTYLVAKFTSLFGSRCGRRGPAICHRGLTVLELIVASTVISILIGLLLPAAQTAREAARDIQCRDHLRQIGVALFQRCNINGKLPPGWHTVPDGVFASGWASYLLRDLEESNCRSTACDFSARSVTAYLIRTPAIFVCPSDAAEPQFELFRETDKQKEHGQSSESLGVFPQANYLGVFGNSDPDLVSEEDGEGTFIGNRQFRLSELTRGVSQVMFVGERSARKLPSTWIGTYLSGENAQSRIVGLAELGPNRDDSDESEFDSRHPSHSNFLWGDGRVQAVADDVDRLIYQATARRE